MQNNDLIPVSQIKKQICRDSGMSKATEQTSSTTGISGFNT